MYVIMTNFTAQTNSLVMWVYTVYSKHNFKWQCFEKEKKIINATDEVHSKSTKTLIYNLIQTNNDFSAFIINEYLLDFHLGCIFCLLLIIVYVLCIT
jgi:hypothetical protein